ncbi:hypothetical protein V8F06_008984 [Rhypophila decipiens]
MSRTETTGTRALRRLRNTLRENLEGHSQTKLTKEVFFNFVSSCGFQWFGQAGRPAVRLRLLMYARKNLDEVKPWFVEAESLRPGFFKHPHDCSKFDPPCSDKYLEEPCKPCIIDFDAFVDLGLTPAPRGDSEHPARLPPPLPALPTLTKTHFLNDHNTIPAVVAEKYPEVEDMTREEAWNWSFAKCAAHYEDWINSVVDMHHRAAEALVVDQDPSAMRLRDWLVGLNAKLRASSRDDGRFSARSLSTIPHSILLHDWTKWENARADALAKRLPDLREFRPTNATNADLYTPLVLAAPENAHSVASSSHRHTRQADTNARNPRPSSHHHLDDAEPQVRRLSSSTYLSNDPFGTSSQHAPPFQEHTHPASQPDEPRGSCSPRRHSLSPSLSSLATSFSTPQRHDDDGANTPARQRTRSPTCGSSSSGMTTSVKVEHPEEAVLDWNLESLEEYRARRVNGTERHPSVPHDDGRDMIICSYS